MRNLIKHSLVAVSLSALVACGGSDKPAQEPSPMDMPPPPPPPAPPPLPPVTEVLPATPEPMVPDTALTTTTGAETKPLTDGEIVAVTVVANNGEIEMAEIAKRTATNTDVKNFAAMMIARYREMDTKGKAVATKAKITPADNDAATALKTDVQMTITTLKTQKGMEFDKAYIDSQVKTQREVLQVIDSKLLPNAQNGELKTHLTDARNRVAMHLAKAEEIKQKLDSAPTTDTTGTTPAAGKGKGKDTGPKPPVGTGKDTQPATPPTPPTPKK